MTETRYRKIANDNEDEIQCGRKNCNNKATRDIRITIRGQSFFKIFCQKYYIEEAEAEEMFRLGL